MTCIKCWTGRKVKYLNLAVQPAQPATCDHCSVHLAYARKDPPMKKQKMLNPTTSQIYQQARIERRDGIWQGENTMPMQRLESGVFSLPRRKRLHNMRQCNAVRSMISPASVKFLMCDNITFKHSTTNDEIVC